MASSSINEYIPKTNPGTAGKNNHVEKKHKKTKKNPISGPKYVDKALNVRLVDFFN